MGCQASGSAVAQKIHNAQVPPPSPTPGYCGYCPLLDPLEALSYHPALGPVVRLLFPLKPPLAAIQEAAAL